MLKGRSHIDINPILQAIINANDDDVLVRGSVDIFGTINLMASYTPGWETNCQWI